MQQSSSSTHLQILITCSLIIFWINLKQWHSYVMHIHQRVTSIKTTAKQEVVSIWTFSRMMYTYHFNRVVHRRARTRTARSTHKTTISYNSPYVGLTVVEDTPILHTSTPILDFVRYVEDKKRILSHQRQDQWPTPSWYGKLHVRNEVTSCWCWLVTARDVCGA